MFLSDSTALPQYVRQAAKKAQARWVAVLGGSYQLLTTPQAREYVANIRSYQ